MAGIDTRYLEFWRGAWMVCVAQRQGKRKDGSPKIVKRRRSLHTASLREAQRLRWGVVAELKQTILSPNDDPASWRSARAASHARAASDLSGEPYGPVDAALSDRLDFIERQQGETTT
jgi:hypothetical protein